MRMLGNFDFHLPHTFVQGFDLLYTGVNSGKSEPKQMDYMATTAPPRWITKAKRGDYDATGSDHFPLVLTLIAKNAITRCRRYIKQAKIKPIGWMLTELTYNDNLRAKIGLEAPVEVAEVMHTALHVYTDGSCTGAENIHTRSRRANHRENRRDAAKTDFIKAKARWAAVFYNRGAPPRAEFWSREAETLS